MGHKKGETDASPEYLEITGSMTAAGAAAGAAGAAAEGKLRFDGEAHVAHVDLHTADTFEQGRFEAESETVDIEGLVVFGRLIQSQCETRAASAAGGQIDADAGLGLIGEESLELGTSRVGKMDHSILHCFLLP